MYTLAEAAGLEASAVGEEALLLARHAARLPSAFVLTPSFEEAFYRTANLPEQLGRLFAPLNPARLDEDALERLCEQAQRLVRGSSLLDDHVQLFYRALANAGLSDGPLHLRRPGERQAEAARSHPPGSEALQALKRLWARDWRFEAVLARLDAAGSVALEARAVLLLAGELGREDPALAAELSLQRAWVNGLGLVGVA